MKKILSLVLAMLMIFSMVPAVFAAETSESDYQAAIEYLKAIELYKGTTDGDAADELVERYQMALFTARMVTGRVDKAYWETDANDSDFTDIDELNAEALGGVCYAAQQGIVNGIGGGEFAPFDNVTYRDAIVMIVRALGFNYPDSGYPWSYVNKARELGVLDGITGVSYTAEVKREVIAQLLYNAINAEIKGETIAATVFGVEETIVMVTATPDGIVYKADGAASVKANMVRVSAVDAAGEPIGAEYYVPFKELGLKNGAAANAAVGAYFKLTHKGNFSNFLACESLTQVFENTVDKKEVKYSSNVLTLGKDSYLVLSAGSDYTGLNNNQGTVSGNKEIKVFKAWGANNATTVGNTGYYLGTDGKVYSYENPFTPYAIYSNITKSWFIVTVNNHG
ncbi:MAG: S-layer homology domain-containing protein, partial [Clostridia bacterium]|nr:S-layer homology domain-containing protein [Clostridia bacterium]